MIYYYKNNLGRWYFEGENKGYCELQGEQHFSNLRKKGYELERLYLDNPEDFKKIKAVFKDEDYWRNRSWVDEAMGKRRRSSHRSPWKEETSSYDAQNRKILAHLRSGHKLTALSAAKRPFRCLRLSGRIFDLRDAGYEIHTRMIYKNGKRIAEYYM